MLPSDMNFPRIGEVWETIRNCDVLFRAWFTKRPGTDGKARLEQGTKVRILFIDDPKPLYVHYEPVGYRELEAGIVPEKLRSAPDYDHYELYAVMARLPCWLDKDTPFFSELFKPVEGAT
jgi:hypothetical protein